MIQFKDVSFRYEANEQNILNDINLTIDDGEVICLTGASGCGKTTVTRMLNGIIPHFYNGEIDGQILMNDKDIQLQEVYELTQQSGSVFQNPRSQFFCLNTTSELAFELENYGTPANEIKQRINQSVKQFNLEHLLNRDIFNLSGGEKQLLACSAIQVYGHKLIILDEPSSNLDFNTILKLKQMLKIWKSEGKTIVIAEHRLHYLTEIVDRFIVMSYGSIKKIYNNQQFNRLSHVQLTNLGLRMIHLRQLKAKSSLNSRNGYLNLHRFYFKYKRNQPLALNIDDVHISKGKVTTIIGRNGSGKSTLARGLTGVEKKFKGTVDYNQVTLKPRHRLSNVYMVFQDVNNQLFAESVEEELKLSNSTLDDEMIRRCLRNYSISEHLQRHPLSLSGGEKQRLAIASAVETKREILVFDEPSSGLDGHHMREMSKIINRLAYEGHTVLVITHDYEMLLSCTDEILHLEDGKVKAQYEINNDTIEKLQTFFNII